MKYHKASARAMTNNLMRQVDSLSAVVKGKQLAAMLEDGWFPATQTAELKKAVDKVEDLIAELTMELMLPFDVKEICVD